MLRYIGVICIFLFTFYLIFCYERYQKMRILQSAAFTSLIEFLLGEMHGCGRPLLECIRDFHSETLERMHFLRDVENGASPHDAYVAARAHLCLPREMDAVLERAFASFGHGSRREECRRLSVELAQAVSLLDAEKQEQTRRVRLCRTLATASAMGLVILLL